MAVLGIAFAFYAVTLPAAPNPTADAAKALESSLKDHDVYLRSYSATDIVNVEYAGGNLQFPKANIFMLAAIRIRHVSIGKDSILMEGTRTTLPGVKDTSSEPTPIKILIKLNGADAQTVLPQLESTLFYATLYEALKSAPRPWVWTLAHAFVLAKQPFPGRDGKPVTPKLVSALPLLCAEDSEWRLQRYAKEQGPPDGKDLILPKIKHSSEASYTQSAERAGAQGSVAALIMVNLHGNPVQAWILSNPGYGLGDTALKAISSTTFDPALWQGEACATVALFVMDFKIKN